MPNEITMLRLPRLVVGTVARGREPERIAVHDEVPVAVASLDRRGVAVAWREGGGFPRDFLALDGIPYAPLDHARPGEPDTPAGLWEGLAERIASEAGIGERHTGQTQQRLADWAAALPGASRRRGLVAEGAIRFRSIEDDGRAAQAALARAIGANLAVLDGRLHHRASLPRVRVDCGEEEVHAFDAQPGFPLGGSDGEPLGFEDFRIDRRDEARAYVAALCEEAGLVDGSSGRERLAVVDAGALRACHDRAGDEADLAAVAAAEGLCRALSPVVGALPDAEALLYLAIRREARARGSEALRSLLDGAGRLEAALAAIDGGPDAERAREAAAALRPTLVRHRRIDRPRLFLDGGDAEAIGLLAPGP